ncbi:MAG: hypothetical protein AAFW46_13775 [Pseudomonadota bacterium]
MNATVTVTISLKKDLRVQSSVTHIPDMHSRPGASVQLSNRISVCRQHLDVMLEDVRNGSEPDENRFWGDVGSLGFYGSDEAWVFALFRRVSDIGVAAGL